MKKLLLSMILILTLISTSSIVAFAGNSIDEGEEYVQKVVDIINQIEDTDKKEKIAKYLFDPAYVEFDSDSSTYTNLDILKLVEQMSNMTNEEVDNYICQTMNEVIDETVVTPDILLLFDNDTLTEYGFEDNVDVDVIPQSKQSINIVPLVIIRF